MALTDQDKAFLIKIGQELPKEVKETKQKKETQTETPTQETEV